MEERVDWRSAEIKSAFKQIGDAINGLDFSKENSSLSSVSLGSYTGILAVEHLLEKGKEIEDFMKHPSSYPQANIFSLLGRAYYDGFFGSKDLAKASRYFIWGYRRELEDRIDRSVQFAATFISNVLDELPNVTNTTNIEAAIKALHEKLLAERTGK